MLTHFFNSINWVDVALVVLLVRVIFIGVKNGFITELCKFFGVFLALYISLQWYVTWALFLDSHIKWSLNLWQLISFLVLVSLGYGLFWGIRFGLSQLFKAETQHEGFDKYAAGVLAIGRGFLTASLVIFALLLMRQPYVTKQIFSSVSYRLAGKTAVHAYDLMFHQVIDRIFPGQRFNDAVNYLVDAPK